MYAVDNKGYYPCARDHTASATDSTKWHRWTDMIAKYITKQQIDNYQDIAKLRRSSTLWGCPEWTKAQDYNAALAASNGENVYNGYGMNYYCRYYEKGNDTRWWATNGTYQKASTWGIRGSERLLVADSQLDIVYTNGSSPALKSNLKFGPYNPGAHYANLSLWVDARHQKPGLPRSASLGTRAVNVLFADGHAAGATPGACWNAVHNPGTDTLE